MSLEINEQAKVEPVLGCDSITNLVWFPFNVMHYLLL